MTTNDDTDLFVYEDYEPTDEDYENIELLKKEVLYSNDLVNGVGEGGVIRVTFDQAVTATQLETLLKNGFVIESLNAVDDETVRVYIKKTE